VVNDTLARDYCGQVVRATMRSNRAGESSPNRPTNLAAEQSVQRQSNDGARPAAGGDPIRLQRRRVYQQQRSKAWCDYQQPPLPFGPTTTTDSEATSAYRLHVQHVRQSHLQPCMHVARTTAVAATLQTHTYTRRRLSIDVLCHTKPAAVRRRRRNASDLHNDAIV
jgi:hypothetical protein